MSNIGDIERLTQSRVVDLFKNQLGYKYLGHWQNRQGNNNIEEAEIREYLSAQGYSEVLISGAIMQLKQKANNLNKNLYQRNKEVYDLLKYGAKVKPDVSTNHITVNFINWEQPLKNIFAIAEEVTIIGQHQKRPDIIIYINGIALSILELKRGSNLVEEGIRQNITNQQKDYIPNFFTTIQMVLAGNDTQGLRYGCIETPLKYYLKWKEETTSNAQTILPLDRDIITLLAKEIFLELVHDFILYDGGRKKLCRPHQYFGIKATQRSIAKREGGVIWHTQGSGKSLTMVWLAKWILRTNPNARIAIITDRDELDKQIAAVFLEANEAILKANSGKHLMDLIGSTTPRIICSLIHKFGRHSEANFADYITEIKANPPKAIGDIFVFVDECHRTQSGKMHKALKAILPNALFLGFTGTPLVKEDKETTYNVFGKSIHTYKFNEAVEDGVVKDLMYEARDIEQKMSSPEKVDEWFESSTKTLNDFQKNELKKKWGTMQKVLSSKGRIEKIVLDVVMDFRRKPRLASEKGNAILIASSIYEACKFFEVFESTELKNKIAIVTSYNPQAVNNTTENIGADTETDKEYIYRTYTNILQNVQPNTTKTKAEVYEDASKEDFIKHPSKMKLLIVVDKLLTGFDAPPCTYLYIDKNMQDHGLFQAICRVNRLDGDDKDFGYIVDYKNLFKKVNQAITDYTSNAFENYDKEDIEGLLKDRLQKGKERLNNAIEVLDALCEPVPDPKEKKDYLHYFGGITETEEDTKVNEAKRNLLYKETVSLIRGYANIGNELDQIFTTKEIKLIENKKYFYLQLREELKNYCSETLDIKSFEADMRFLLDNYLQAEDSNKISPFDSTTLLELIVKTGIANAINQLPEGLKSSNDTIAETIENNVRKKIIKEHLIDPAYFDEMSLILKELIKERKRKAIEHKEYMKQMFDLVKKVSKTETTNIPTELKTDAQKVLYNNIVMPKPIVIENMAQNDKELYGKLKDEKLILALQIDNVVQTKKQDNWKGNRGKENLIKIELIKLIPDENEMERIFAIIKNQTEY